MAKTTSEVISNKITEIAKGHGGERGAIVSYLYRKCACDWKGKPLTIERIGYLLAQLKTIDLYYIKSVCDDGARRGIPFNRIFFSLLRKH